MSDDQMFPEPKPDRFQHESPIRAFTEWTVAGRYAVGKGFRPSPQHLAVYLDAMAWKEGWELVQILYAHEPERRTMIFRKAPTYGFNWVCPPDEEAILAALTDKPGTVRRILDGGHWGDGTTPDHVEYELPPRLHRRPLNELEPIPTGVYWCDEGGNFYNATSHQGMGVPFYQRWASRKHEFPGDPRLDLPVDVPEDVSVVSMTAAQPGEAVVVGEGLAAYALDDPINPRHYGGTNCAEIGERLTANCYQVLKYVWRLGEKDNPCIELGKAIWYLDREIALGVTTTHRPIERSRIVELTEGRKPFVRVVALALWQMCYGIDSHAHFAEVSTTLRQQLEDEKEFQDCTDRGRGLEP